MGQRPLPPRTVVSSRRDSRGHGLRRLRSRDRPHARRLYPLAAPRSGRGCRCRHAGGGCRSRGRCGQRRSYNARQGTIGDTLPHLCRGIRPYDRLHGFARRAAALSVGLAHATLDIFVAGCALSPDMLRGRCSAVDTLLGVGRRKGALLGMRLSGRVVRAHGLAVRLSRLRQPCGAHSRLRTAAAAGAAGARLLCAKRGHRDARPPLRPAALLGVVPRIQPIHIASHAARRSAARGRLPNMSGHRLSGFGHDAVYGRTDAPSGRRAARRDASVGYVERRLRSGHGG